MKPHQGWVAAEVTGSTDTPLAVVAEAGYRPNSNVALYGDAWAQPTLGRAGADLGARFRSQFDVYAGGWADLSGNAGGQVGMKWNF